MARDFESFIVDPSLLDPSIDATNLRTTTPTRQELLSDVPEFSGIKFDPTQKDYVSDLYALYSGQLPSTPAPAVTAPDINIPLPGGGGGGGGGQTTATTTAPITAPATTPTNMEVLLRIILLLVEEQHLKMQEEQLQVVFMLQIIREKVLVI
jgi:hypothetical protein